MSSILRVIAELVSALLVSCIRFYQLAISPALGPRCRFHPTCSHYAIEALRLHGPARGLALASYRLARCQPFAAGGYDPVPARAIGSAPPEARAGEERR